MRDVANASTVGRAALPAAPAVLSLTHRAALLVALWLVAGRGVAGQEAASAVAPPMVEPHPVALAARPLDHSPQDTVRARPRRKAFVYSDWYGRRATIHRVASWATLPLVAAEVASGQALFRQGPEAPLWARRGHGMVVGALGGLFAVNSATGLWNLWEARPDPNGRRWRTAHALLMLAADGGFFYAGTLADPAENSVTIRSRHRTVALASTGVALSSYFLMLPPLRRD